ncbi:MAG: hypothetical protein KDA42_19650, partial [Planctomycetales bacterium]|nr:hypothetical protein [Planctomycetales bacterium]
MELMEVRQRHDRAARELNEILDRDDGNLIVERLCHGMNVLRDALYTRIHEDVERMFGLDSAIAPVSEERTEKITKLEIEIYQVVISFVAACDYGYFPRGNSDMLEWLIRLRLGHGSENRSVMQRVEYYLNKDYSDRRLAFSNVLVHTLHESRRAPLIIFRLFPRSIQ